MANRLPVRIKSILPFLLLALVAINSSACDERNERNRPKPSIQDSSAFLIQVSVDGFYQIDLEAFQSDTTETDGKEPAEYQLTDGLEIIPHYLHENSLIFYGRGPDSRYSSSRTYHLTLGFDGIHMDERILDPINLALVELITQQHHFEENIFYDSTATGPMTDAGISPDPWFWETIQVGQLKEIEVELPSEPSGKVSLEFGFYGVTSNPTSDPDHNIDIIVNGSHVGQITWEGATYYSASINVEPGIVHEGKNTITLDNSGADMVAIDISRLDWITLEYKTEPVLIDNRFSSLGVQGELIVDGFDQRPLAFDITDRQMPVLLTGWDYKKNQAKLPLPQPVDIALVEPRKIPPVPSITPLTDTDLRNPEIQADMIIVTSNSLIEPLMPLVNARQKQNLNVRLVPVEEIYMHFGSSQKGPHSIADFVRYAMLNWSEPSPRYLFLVGEASYDYRNYLDAEKMNSVPAPMVSVAFGGETVSDSELADVDGDDMPDLAVGRWPVNDPDQVTELVERTLAYEQSTAQETALFVADGSSHEFSRLNETIIRRSRFYSESISNIAGEDFSDLQDSWNAGAWLVTYSGHGSMDRWGRTGVLDNDVFKGTISLETPPPIVMQMTCLTGYFAHPTEQSLSETMLLQDGGPVLVIGATSLTLSSQQEPFGTNLLKQINNPDIKRIGDAVFQAKAELNINQNTGLREISDTFGLFGDPSTLIVRPE